MESELPGDELLSDRCVATWLGGGPPLFIRTTSLHRCDSIHQGNPLLIFRLNAQLPLRN